MDKFKGKYRIPSNRLANWDYSKEGLYFITIVTLNRICWFGKIENNTMILSEIGKIVKEEWDNTVKLRPDMNLIIGEYVIMPNHFHSIIYIGENEYNSKCRDAMPCVSDEHIDRNRFSPQSKNLASVIRGFKSAVTINSRKSKPEFSWQPRYHDRIIRNEIEYIRIRDYIHSNPYHWYEDALYV